MFWLTAVGIVGSGYYLSRKTKKSSVLGVVLFIIGMLLLISGVVLTVEYSSFPQQYKSFADTVEEQKGRENFSMMMSIQADTVYKPSQAYIDIQQEILQINERLARAKAMDAFLFTECLVPNEVQVLRPIQFVQR